MFVLLSLVLCLMIINNVRGVTNIGPADIVIESVEECEDQAKYSQPYDIAYFKKNRTHVAYNACYNFETPMDETYMLNVTAAKWGDGGWKPNAFDFVGNDLCKILMTHVKDLWTSILRNFGLAETCPMAAGIYCAKEFMAPLENMFPSMLYGKFRADIMINVNEKPFLCFRTIVNSVKAKGGGKKHPL